MFWKLLGALAPLLLVSIPACADSLTLTLDQPVLYSPPGGISQPALCQNSDGSGFCVIFTGTITTSDPSQDFLLNELDVTMSSLNPDGGAYVFDNTDDSSTFGNAYFLGAVPQDLGLSNPAGNTYSGGIFEVDVLAAAAAGTYNGTATIDFTDEINCTDTCTVSTPFTVIVVPEPDALFLAGTGLVALTVMRRRFASGRK